MLQLQVLSDLVQSRGGTFDDLYNRESAGAPDWIRNGSLPLEASVHYGESKKLYRTTEPLCMNEENTQNHIFDLWGKGAWMYLLHQDNCRSPLLLSDLSVFEISAL